MPRGEGRRIAHTKSRLGCIRCKARKVKCDEVHPRCSNCIKYERVCQYPGASSNGNLPTPSPTKNLNPPFATSDETSRRSTTPSSTNAIPYEPSGQTRGQEALLELQLMHHYSTVTSQQPFMANYDPGVKEIFTRLAPVLALKHESLMNGILAAAALHIYKLDPEKTEFRDLNRKYFSTAVGDQVKAVAVINPNNADALCLAAAFIAFQALAVPQDHPHYSPPSVWLDLTTGHVTLFRSAWAWLNQSNRILAIVNAEPNLQSFREKCWQEYPAMFPDNLGNIFPALLDFQDPTEDLDSERIAAYKWCMAYIGHSLTEIDKGEDQSKIRRLLSAYGAMSPPIYKTMIRERQARALVVLAHFFSLFKAVDSVWWLRGIAEREVFGVQSILPERWQWAMAWPIQKLSFYAAAAVPSRGPVNTLSIQ